MNPSTPANDIKEAREAAKLRAAKMMKGIPDEANSTEPPEEKIDSPRCRFHDLRHSAVFRILDAGIPIIKVAKIEGWSPSTMVRMATRYGRFTLEELRSAAESISRAKSEEESPVFSPVSEKVGLGGAAN